MTCKCPICKQKGVACSNQGFKPHNLCPVCQAYCLPTQPIVVEEKPKLPLVIEFAFESEESLRHLETRCWIELFQTYWMLANQYWYLDQEEPHCNCTVCILCETAPLENGLCPNCQSGKHELIDPNLYMN